MSFLSSHRLHWGVHHELSDNFRIQLERIAESAGEPLRMNGPEGELAPDAARATADGSPGRRAEDLLGP